MTSQICIQCDKPFVSKNKAKKICSQKCNRDRRNQKRGYTGCGYHIKCAQCGKTFHSRRKVNKWCSNECMNANRRANYTPKEKKSTKPCQVCGTHFVPRWGERSKYCSRKCNRQKYNQSRDVKGEYRKYHPVKKQDCIVCGDTFQKDTSAITCSVKCREINNRNRKQQWKTLRLSQDLTYYMVEKVRKRINHNKNMITKGGKPHGAMRHLGYSIQDLIDYWVATDWPNGLPDDWYDGTKWHIDHINSTYDELLSKEDITMSDVIHHNRIENLRLVSAIENMKKGRKSGINWRQQHG